MQDRNSVLAGTFKSRKASAMYTCTCDTDDDGCGSYKCLKDTEDEEGLTGEEVHQGEQGSSSVEPGVRVTVISPTSAAVDGCRDTDTATSYNFGQRFTKVTTLGQQPCRCESSGEIVCLKSCPLPTAPVPSYDPYENPPKYGCYDVWQKQWYRNYETWDRQRLMNDNVDPPLYGTYRCSCSMGVTQCSARDIPCCDRKTGEFVGGGLRFFTSMSDVDYKCTCRMGRGRFSDCIPANLVRQPTASHPATYVPSQPISYRPTTQVYCRDRYNQNARYTADQTWTQWRTRGGRREQWTCTCKVNGLRGQARCRRGGR